MQILLAYHIPVPFIFMFFILRICVILIPSVSLSLLVSPSGCFPNTFPEKLALFFCKQDKNESAVQ